MVMWDSIGVFRCKLMILINSKKCIDIEREIICQSLYKLPPSQECLSYSPERPSSA